MLDAVTSAIVTGAAGNIIAQMVSGRVAALQARIGQIFHLGGEQESTRAVEALGHDAAALARQETTPTALSARWTALLASHLAEHPEARAAIEELASSRDGTSVGMQINTGSGTFIGRDSYNFNSPSERES